jgi:GAF domain-containing protein
VTEDPRAIPRGNGGISERRTTGVQEGELQRIVREAAAAAKMPMSVLSLIEQGRRWIAATLGTGLIDRPELDTFFSQLIVQPGEPLIISDTALDKRFTRYKRVREAVRFIAGFPIVDRGGYMLGSLYVAHFRRIEEIPDLSSVARLAREAERLLGK